MISLLFRILGDATGFNRVMQRDMPESAKKGGQKAGKEAGSAFGKEFGSQIKGAIGSAIGVSAILAAIKKSMAGATQIQVEARKLGVSVEAYQELQRASKYSGLSISDIETMAKDNPAKFKQTMAAAESTYPIKSADEIASLASADKSLTTALEEASTGFAKLWKGTVDQGTKWGTRLWALAEISDSRPAERNELYEKMLLNTYFDELGGDNSVPVKNPAIRRRNTNPPTAEEVLMSVGSLPGFKGEVPGSIGADINRHLIQLHQDLLKMDNTMREVF